MIGEVIDIIEADSTIMSALGSGASNRIHAIQRRQSTGLPCIVVDLTNFEPQETKSHSSFVDFITIQLSVYSDNPRDSYTISTYLRDALDKYVGTVNTVKLDIRFEDLQVGISAEDESFVTQTEFIITSERSGQSAHS